MVEVAALAVTAAAAGYGVYSGERANAAQGAARRRQQAAQEQAVAAAASQQRQQAMEARAANQRAPDMAALLAFEQTGSPTRLTNGADPNRLRLGRNTLLGGGLL